MATLDKATVRKEIDRIKDDFETLRADGNVTPESLALMNSLFMIVELILSIFMERTTRKNNANSSIPSSQTDKDESALITQGSQGKGKQLDKRNIQNSRTVETVRVSEVASCDICGESLTEIPCIRHERRTKIDIVFEKVIEHADAEIKECPGVTRPLKDVFRITSPAHYNMAMD